MKYTSYESDSGAGETGLNYAAFRQHSSGLGRFMSADLLAGNPGAPQSLNRYAYATNDPVNQVDPLGLFTMCFGPVHSDDGLRWYAAGRALCWDVGDMGEGGGGGGGGGSTELPKNLQEALARCLDKLFGVTLTSFDPSRPGHNGSFTGAAGERQLSFANDTTTFTGADLNMIVFGTKEAPNQESSIKGMTREGTVVTKYFLKYIPNYFSLKTFSLATSFTASDLSTSDILSTQIHELGHQIAESLGMEPKNAGDESKTPFGAKLQDCFNQEAAKKK